MEPGECSGAKCSDEPWAKLIPSDSRYPDVEIRYSEVVVCSEITYSSLEKHGWCKITKNPDEYSATIQNMSSNAILVDETMLHKDDTLVIKCGSEITSGPDREGYLNYRFKVLLTQEQCKKKLKISLDVEHIKCSICLNIWHNVVTVAPCLHNFCNGCFSEWLRRSQQKQSDVLCPQCRAVVHCVGRNHFLHNVEEEILQSDLSLQRTSEEVEKLDSFASIKSNLVINTGKTLRRKRNYSSWNEETNVLEFSCPQCGTALGGFRCSQTTAHLQCYACGGMMPSRNDINLPQHCLGCDRAFCGAYWQAQGVVQSDLYAVCIPGNFKPAPHTLPKGFHFLWGKCDLETRKIAERAISRIPFSAHQNNQYEQDITERCIRQMGKTLQDVISDWITKLNNREIDRTRMPLNHAEMITDATYLCNDCYDKLVSYLLYWFRVTLPSCLLPPDASTREDCWYGYACRTQHHIEEHARKRNHVCRPTRGNNV